MKEYKNLYLVMDNEENIDEVRTLKHAINSAKLMLNNTKEDVNEIVIYKAIRVIRCNGYNIAKINDNRMIGKFRSLE